MPPPEYKRSDYYPGGSGFGWAALSDSELFHSLRILFVVAQPAESERHRINYRWRRAAPRIGTESDRNEDPLKEADGIKKP